MRSDHLFGRVSRRDPRPLPAEAPEAAAPAPPAAEAEKPTPDTAETAKAA
jgi:hypothetical protein